MREILSDAEWRGRMLSGKEANGVGGFLFFGEEDYLKQFDLEAARKHISPDEGFSFFNDLRIDALDFTPASLLDALMPLPMGAEQKIVSVTGLSFIGMKPSDLEGLCDALAALREYDYNVLILSSPSGLLDPGYLPKRPSDLLKKLSEYLTVVRFEKSTPARLALWCGKHFAHNGVSASPEIASSLVSYCGQNMFTLSHEVDKVSYYVLSHGRTEVLAEDIRTAAIAETEYDAFAFANALTDGKNAEALKILSTMKARRVEPIAALSEVTRVFCDLYTVFLCSSDGKTLPEIQKQTRMHEYKIRLYQKSALSSGRQKLLRALTLCREADLLMKQSQSGYAALERLLCAL